MAKRGGAKTRKSFFLKLLVVLILAGFATFLYCADQGVTPVEAVKYLLGQADLPQLPDMPQLPEMPHFGQVADIGLSGSPSPEPAASPSPEPGAAPGQGPESPAGYPTGEILQKSGMHAYILDVGQGNCAFLRSPGGQTMLIDTGESSYYPVVDAFLQEQGVERLDVVVATHPHSDHIGSMAKVIENYEVGAFYLPEKPHTTVTYEKMLTALDKKGVETHAAYGGKGAQIPWDPLVTVDILSPLQGVKYDDLNNISVVLRIAYGETSVIITGDAEAYAEEAMLAKLPQSSFPATVLCVGHHGSSTSTSDAFLQAVSPSLAVISVGEGNDYGHPSGEVLEKLSRLGVPYFRTDESGTVHLLLNGKKVLAETEK